MRSKEGELEVSVWLGGRMLEQPNGAKVYTGSRPVEDVFWKLAIRAGYGLGDVIKYRIVVKKKKKRR